MTHTTDTDHETLGTSLTSLSKSADGLSRSVRQLNRAVDDLQLSTERCGENQRVVSKSLARAADSLGMVSSEGPSAANQSASDSFAPADD